MNKKNMPSRAQTMATVIWARVESEMFGLPVGVGVGVGTGPELSRRRHGGTLVLVSVIVICFGGRLSVGYQRCGVLGLFLVALWCYLCHRRLLCGSLSALV